MTNDERISLAEHFERVIADKELRDVERFEHLRDAVQEIILENRLCAADRSKLHEGINLSLGRERGSASTLGMGIALVALLTSVIAVLSQYI